MHLARRVKLSAWALLVVMTMVGTTVAPGAKLLARANDTGCGDWNAVRIPTSSAKNVSVYIDNEPVDFKGAQPVIAAGRVLVIPLPTMLEKIDARTQVEEDAQMVKVQRDNLTISLVVWSPKAKVTHGVSSVCIPLGVPAMRVAKQTMIPLRFVSAELGAGVSWDATTRTVTITTPQVNVAPRPSFTSGSRFEPGEVTIIAIRAISALPSFLGGSLPSPKIISPPIRLRNVKPGLFAMKAGDTIAKTYLASDTAGRLMLTLIANDELDKELGDSIGVKVKVTESPRSGKYTGTLETDPTSTDSPKLKVTVNVQDDWYWAALAIFLGALIGWVLAVLGDKFRSRAVLRSKLNKLAEDYWQKRTRINCLYQLDRAPPAPPGAFPAPPQPPAEALIRCLSNASRAERIACDIGNTWSREALGNALADINDLRELINLWDTWCSIATELQRTRNEVQRNFPIAAIVVETNTLIGNAIQLPDNALEMRVLLDRFREQLQATEFWLKAWSLYVEAEHLYVALLPREGKMTAADLELLRNSNPGALRDTYLQTVRTLEDFTQGELIARFYEVDRVLHALNLAYPNAVRSLLRLGAPPPITVARVPLAEVQPSERIIAEARASDWAASLITFVLTGIVFLVTIYADKNFGSLWQYLSAFAAGGGGQLAINWKLLPWFRSYQSIT